MRVYQFRLDSLQPQAWRDVGSSRRRALALTTVPGRGVRPRALHRLCERAATLSQSATAQQPIHDHKQTRKRANARSQVGNVKEKEKKKLPRSLVGICCDQ